MVIRVSPESVKLIQRLVGCKISVCFYFLVGAHSFMIFLSCWVSLSRCSAYLNVSSLYGSFEMV